MLKFRASVAWHLPSRGPGLSCSRGGGRTPRLPGAMEPPGNGAFDPDDGLGERTLFDLPEEVVESVLSLLPHTDVCRFGSTCKQALVAARSETVWRALLWRDFAVKAPNGASRQSYSSLHADGQLWRTMQWRPVECGGPSQLLKLASAPDDALVIGTGERLRGCRPRHASSLISCAAPDLLPPDTLCSLFGGHHLLRRERRLPVGAPAQPERLHMLRGVPGPVIDHRAILALNLQLSDDLQAVGTPEAAAARRAHPSGAAAARPGPPREQGHGPRPRWQG